MNHSNQCCQCEKRDERCAGYDYELCEECMTKREYQLADYLAEKARVDSAPDRAAVPVTADFMAWDSRIAGHDPKLASRLQNVNAPLAKTRKQEWDALLAVRKAGYEHGKDDGFGHGLLLGIPIGILLLFTALCFWYGC